MDDDPSSSQPQWLGKLRLGSTPSPTWVCPSPLLSRRFFRPQPLVLERVLVAVGVGHEDEPEFGRRQEPVDFTVVGPPPVDVVVHQPPVDLGGDPFTRVLGGAVEDRRTRAVRYAWSALGQLDRDDLATLAGVAEYLELHQQRVVARRGVELVADAAGLVERAPDVEAVV